MQTETSAGAARRRGYLRRFLPYFKPYWKTAALDLACASLTTLCDLVLPLIVRDLTNRASYDLASLTARYIWQVGALYIALRVLDTAANYFMTRMGHIVGARIETDMRRDLFSHLQTLSFSYYSNTKVGQIMSRITRDLFDITEFSHHCPEEFLIAFLKLALSFAILLRTDVLLTVIVFSLLPLMALTVVFSRKNLSAAFLKERRQIGELNAQVEDSLLGIRVVKSFANEAVEEEKFRRGNAAFLRIKQEIYRHLAAFHSGVRMFDGVLYIAIVIAGGLFMLDGRITPGDFVAYLLYANTLLATVRRLAEFTEQFMQGVTGIRRFFEIMDVPAEITDAPQARPLEHVTGDIRFEHVTFRYADGSEDVLTDVDLHVAPGDNVALVGPSGGGKTTLSNLIPRFYDVTAGRILLDGRDLREITLGSLRGQIGVVQQDVYLFSGTIYENIRYGRPGASREEVEEAARLAGAHEFISAFPEGYDTYVGERGVKLSGGQKQRISIARVFLKNPPILILDEATSALDNESEQLVQQSLERLSQGRTTFTIAHRLSTIRRAKVILVLTEDGIVEQGSHEELLEKKGVYYRLYQMSLGDDFCQEERT